jgi:hypothetical protein
LTAAGRRVAGASAACHRIEDASTEGVAMDQAQLILYGVATYLAIKSLVSLMSDYRQDYKKKLAEELKAAVPPAPAPLKVAPPGKKIAGPASPRTAAAATPQAAAVKNTANNPAKNPAKNPVNDTAKPEAPAKKAG